MSDLERRYAIKTIVCPPVLKSVAWHHYPPGAGYPTYTLDIQRRTI